MEVILSMNTDLTPDEATLLYIGLTTDTGCFQYSNTSAASFRAAAELLRLGQRNGQHGVLPQGVPRAAQA